MSLPDRLSVHDLTFVGFVVLFGLGGWLHWWTTPTWEEIRGPLAVGVVIFFTLNRNQMSLEHRLDRLEGRR